MKRAGELPFDIVIILVMLIICFITLYPVWYTLVHSFNEGTDAAMGGIYWWPRKPSLENYETIFRDNTILQAYWITIARTVITTIAHIFVTSMFAFGLSKRYLLGRKYILGMGIITMFFSGGLIPLFILVTQIGLYNNFLAYVFLGLFSFFNVFIFMSFLSEIPDSLEESAKIDGANDFCVYIKIILPLSLPVIATIALFTGVGNWNDYFMGVIYMKDRELQPIQTFLYRLIAESASNQMLVSMPGGIRQSSVTSQSIRMATMIATTVPIVCAYPFLQKYFVKGMMLGAVKG